MSSDFQTLSDSNQGKYINRTIDKAMVQSSEIDQCI